MTKLTKKFFTEQGRKGGKKSRAALTPEQRSTSAKKAALKRWGAK